MGDQSPNDIRGWLQPWPLSVDQVWVAQATFTEQSTIAGAAEANQASNLVITTSGTQDNEADITITTAQGGTPGAEKGGTFTWKPTSAADDYGWDNPGSLTGWERIRWASTGGTPQGYELPDFMALDDGTAIIAAQFNDNLNKKLVIYQRSGISTAWTQITIRTELSATYSTDFHPGLCRLPNDDLLLFAWNDLDNSTVQLDVYISKDSGVTWSLLNGGALDTVISTSASGYTPGRIRAAANNDQVLVFARLVNNNAAAAIREHMIQLASSNLGASFATVNTSSAQLFGYPDVFVDQNGKFRVAAIIASNRIAIWTMPHAFYDLSSLGTYAAQTNIIDGIVPATFTANVITDGGLSIWQDPDGSIYSMQKDISNALWYLATSRDNGATWSFFQDVSSGSSTPYSLIYTSASGTTQIKNPAGATCKGQQLVIHEHVSSGTSLDKSLSALYLGGYSNRTMPGKVLYPTRLQRVGFSKNWLPFDLPQNTGLFSSSGSGVTESITNGYLGLLDGSGGGTITYSASAVSGTIDQGMIVRARLSDVQGSGTDHRSIRARLADGSKNYDVSVRIYRDSVVLWDNTAGAQIAQATIDTDGSSLSMLMFFYGSSVYLFAMSDEGTPIQSKPKDLRNYTSINGAVSDAGGGTSGNILQFGHLTAPAAALETYWHELHYVSGADTGRALTGTAYSNAEPISGREYPSIGFYAWIDGGMMISTKDGPAVKGETFQIQKSSKYPLEKIFFKSSPSPRVFWRSNAVANPATTNISEQFIPFQLDTSIGTTQASNLGNDMIALHLQGINFKDATLEMWNGASWVVKANINAADQLSNKFSRKGSTVTVGTGGSTDFYLFHNEAKNWRVLLDDLAGNAVWRRVEWNTEGIFGDQVRGKTAVLKLVDAETTDPTAGTMWLVPENLTVIVNMLSVEGSAWGLRIPAQKTLEGDARISHFSFGPMVINAPQYSRGRTIAWAPNVELYEQPDNVIRPHSKSPGRRTLSVSWSEGVDTRNFYADSLTTMDFWEGTATASADPIANIGDVAQQMEGLYRYLVEGEHSTVYIPRIKYADSAGLDVQILNRRHNQILCFPAGELNYENVLGDEMKDEVFRVSSVTFTEIV